MSGGSPLTPGGANFMRQRHSWGYASGGDDLEDDACSKPMPQTPSIPRARTWVEILENLLWIASAVFIIYFGDWHSNLVYLLWHDDRIRRIPLYLGFGGVVISVAYFFYTSMSRWGVRKTNENWDMLSASALPMVTLLGLSSFCLFTWALWPIWSFLTLPLVHVGYDYFRPNFQPRFGFSSQFTLFMAGMVISPYLISGTLKPPSDEFRLD